MIILQAVNPQDFFTLGSFATLLGATGIVFMVCGVVQSVFNFSPKWFALIISICVSFIGASLPGKVPEQGEALAQQVSAGLKYLIALLNGFLIFSSATGSNQLLGTRPPVPATGTDGAAVRPQPVATQRRSFNSLW